MSNPALLLEVRGLSKSYPGVRALDNVDFDVMRGEVHCLAGENGAGKSTLIEIIGGSYQKDSGTICISGKEVTRTRGCRPATRWSAPSTPGRCRA